MDGISRPLFDNHKEIWKEQQLMSKRLRESIEIFNSSCEKSP